MESKQALESSHDVGDLISATWLLQEPRMRNFTSSGFSFCTCAFKKRLYLPRSGEQGITHNVPFATFVQKSGQLHGI